MYILAEKQIVVMIFFKGMLVCNFKLSTIKYHDIYKGGIREFIAGQLIR